MSDNGQRTIRNNGPTGFRGNDGQHYASPGASGPDYGQSSKLPASAVVGNRSGGEMQMEVGATGARGDISTESYPRGMNEESFETPATERNEGEK